MKRRKPQRRGRKAPAPGKTRTTSHTPKPQAPDAPADIPSCAALLELSAVMLGPEGWFGLAKATRSDGAPFVWRRASDAERILLEQVAGGRIVAGHWSVRPGGPLGTRKRKSPGRARRMNPVGCVVHGREIRTG